jgi:SAM-dependent methyltransferase
LKVEAAEAMLEVEEHHPWYQARMVLIREIIENNVLKNSNILDFGCGSGAVLEMLKKIGYTNLRGLDVSSDFIKIAKKRGLKADLIKSDHVNLGSKKYDLILLLDVLEHVENDKALLRKMKSSLRKNGRILITVPAHQFLWRIHDEANQHYRRYSRKKLINLIASSNSKVIYLRWWNSTLFFPLFMASIFGKIKRVLNINSLHSTFGFTIPPNYISRILFKVLSFESKSKVMGKLIGVSLVVYLKK